MLLRLKILFFCFFIHAVAMAQLRSEYVMKAVFFEKITRFVEWPEESNMNDHSKPFVIKVFGENPFGDILENIYSYQTINNKKVTIEYINSVKEISGAHLLFIGESQKDNINEIIDYVKNKPVLTFGETRGFAKNGVHVNFYLNNNKIALEINETQVKKSGLYMSFRLLNQARIVDPYK
jgi:hypothetical protein